MTDDDDRPARRRPMNANVRTTLWFTFLEGSAVGSWAFTVLSGYLYDITGGSNAMVGLAEGVQGVVQVCAALPAGCLADRYSRQSVLRLSALVQLLAIGMTLFALLGSEVFPFVEDHLFPFMCVAMSLWGMFQGMYRGTLDSLFADSIPTGNRSYMRTLKYSLSILALTTGPLVGIGLFVWQGNSWSRQELGWVFVCGVSACFFPNLFLLMLKDSFSLGAESEAFSAGDIDRFTNRNGGDGGGGGGGGGATTTSGGGGDNNVNGSSSSSSSSSSARPGSASVAGTPTRPAANPNEADDAAHELAHDQHHETDLQDTSLGSTSTAGGPPTPGGPTGSSANTPGRGGGRDREWSHQSAASHQSELSQLTSSSGRDGMHDSVRRIVGGGSGRRHRRHGNKRSNRGGSRRRPAVRCVWLRFGMTAKAVPYLVVIGDSIFALASGMTTKFFPLFFKNDISMTPIEVNVIYCATWPTLAIATVLLREVSMYVGRVPAAMVASALGIILLAVLAFIVEDVPNPLRHDWRLIAPIFVVRTALINCAQPLRKTMLNDFVPKNRRATWNSFDSVRRMGWSGSALLGGFLVDKFNYGTTFYITAAIQCVGWLFWIPLLPWVPDEPRARDRKRKNRRRRRRKRRQEAAAAAAAAAAAGGKGGGASGSQLREPLLDLVGEEALNAAGGGGGAGGNGPGAAIAVIAEHKVEGRDVDDDDDDYDDEGGEGPYGVQAGGRRTREHSSETSGGLQWDPRHFESIGSDDDDFGSQQGPLGARTIPIIQTYFSDTEQPDAAGTPGDDEDLVDETLMSPTSRVIY